MTDPQASAPSVLSLPVVPEGRGRPRLALALVVAIVGSLFMTADPGSAARRRSTPARVRRSAPLSASKLARLQVRKKQVAVAARVNALKASNNKVVAALRVLNTNVRATSVRLDAARRQATRASSDAVSARARERKIGRDIATRETQRLGAAVDLYVGGPSARLSGTLGSVDLKESTDREVLTDLALNNAADELDRFNQLQEDLIIARRSADRFEALATQRRTQVAGRLSDLQAATKQQQLVGAATEARIEAAAAESAALSSIDKKLSASILGEDAAALAELRKIRLPAGGGRLVIPRDVPTGASGGTHGIRVATSLQGNLVRLLAAAQANGINLSGGGYRSPTAQVALRAAHCGSGSFAIYQMAASACHPPTARPGQSMHEQGLAIDFTQNGSTLTRGSSGYRWLKGNAAKYGLFNLPSEAWHWSVNGR